MGILRRTKKVEPIEPEIGNANFAKQVKTSDLKIQHPVATRQPLNSQQAVEASKAAAAKKPAQPAATGDDHGEKIFEFASTADNAKRGRKWYIGMAVFFSAIVALNIVLQLYMSAVVIVLLAILVFANATRKPKSIQIAFLAGGLSIGENFYPWSEFENFWILYEPPGLKKLFFKRHGRLLNELSLELADQNPLKIRDMLLPLLPEDPSKEESRIDLVTRTLKL